MEQLNFKNIKPSIKPHKYLELVSCVMEELSTTYKITNPNIMQYLINKFNEQIGTHQKYNTYPKSLKALKYEITCPTLSFDDYFLDRSNFNQITKQIFDLLDFPVGNKIFINLSSVVSINYHKKEKLTYKNLSKAFFFFRGADLSHTKLYDQLSFGSRSELRAAA